MARKMIFCLAIIAGLLSGLIWPSAVQASGTHSASDSRNGASRAGVSSTAQAGWTVECLDCPKRFDGLGERSLAIDSAGKGIVAYGGDALYLARQTSTGWQVETVDSTPGAGLQAGLALGPGGAPTLAYHIESLNEVRLASWDAPAWRIETIAQGGGVALALDLLGRPHVSWISSQGVMLGVRSENGWQIERLDDAPPEIHTTLGIDSRGRAHLVAGQAYYFETLEGWQKIDLAAALGGEVYAASLVLDRQDRLHLAYTDPLAQEIRYAVEQELLGTWEVSTAAAEPLASGQPVLALDALDQPWISFSALPGQTPPENAGQLPDQPNTPGFHLPEADVRLAQRGAAAWSVVSVAGQAVGSAPLAIDAQGQARLALLRGSPASTLELAAPGGASWLYEVIDHAGLPGSASLQVDALGQVHASYVDYAGQAIYHASRDAAGWQTALLAYGYEPSLALDALGQPLVSFSAADAQGDDALTLARRTSASGWDFTTIDAHSPGRGSSLAVDQAGRVHISYLDSLPGRRVRYAVEGASGWELSQVAHFISFIYGAPELTLRPDGLPQVGYAVANSAAQDYPIQLAVLDEMGWFLQSTALTGGGALAFASAGDSTPRLAYAPCRFPNCERALNYASLGDAGWITEVVDAEVRTGQADLALDQAGYAHISYHDEANSDLKYAYQDGLAWRIQTLADAGQVGAESALVLDGGDCPHIVYTDDSRGDLMYAHLTGPILRWSAAAQGDHLTPGGLALNVRWCGQATPATLLASVAGQAAFSDGSQLLTAPVAAASGQLNLVIYPAEGAQPGQPYQISIELAGQHLLKTGKTAAGLFLPVVQR